MSWKDVYISKSGQKTYPGQRPYVFNLAKSHFAQFCYKRNLTASNRTWYSDRLEEAPSFKTLFNLFFSTGLPVSEFSNWLESITPEKAREVFCDPRHAAFLDIFTYDPFVVDPLLLKLLESMRERTQSSPSYEEDVELPTPTTPVLPTVQQVVLCVDYDEQNLIKEVVTEKFESPVDYEGFGISQPVDTTKTVAVTNLPYDEAPSDDVIITDDQRLIKSATRAYIFLPTVEQLKLRSLYTRDYFSVLRESCARVSSFVIPIWHRKALLSLSN